MKPYRYGAGFFAYQQIGALSSARTVVPLVAEHLPTSSVLDVGCGAGAWLRAWNEAGVEDVVAVDGDYVDRSRLLFDPQNFRPENVAAPFDLGRRFDLVQCLEVAEHIPPDCGGTLVDNLTRHASIVLFSAAPPGQGGEHHVNERSYDYWRELFLMRGFHCHDFVRPRIRAARSVECWYRYNTFLFVHQDAVPLLPPEVMTTRIPANRRVSDIAPMTWRVRRSMLRALPPPAVTWLSHAKQRLVLHTHSQAGLP